MVSRRLLWIQALPVEQEADCTHLQGLFRTERIHDLLELGLGLDFEMHFASTLVLDEQLDDVGLYLRLGLAACLVRHLRDACHVEESR